MTTFRKPQNEATDCAATVPDDTHEMSRVYQAQGMVMVQLNVSLDEAMEQILAYVEVQQRPLGEVARDIVDRRLCLRSDTVQ